MLKHASFYLVTSTLFLACGTQQESPFADQLGGAKAEGKGSCCRLRLVADPVVDAYDAVLALLEADKPYASIARYDAAGCGSSVAEAVIEQEFSTYPEVLVSSKQVAGADAFIRQLTQVASELEDRQGEWTPQTATEAALFNLRGLLEGQISQRIAASTTWTEVLVYTDGGECSEQAAGLFDPVSEMILLLRIHPLC